MDQTDVLRNEIEKFILLKVKSFDENTSSEDIYALTELVRVVSNLKQIDSNTNFLKSIAKLNTGLQKVNLP